VNRTVEKSANRSFLNVSSKKNFNFKYHFFLGNEKVRVCKTYYLLTLAISEQFVYTTLKNRELITGVPIPLNIGKHRKKFISEERKNFVRSHINSFPTFESHYRRNESSKVYLESSLNIQKMYDLYIEKCNALNEIPVKQSYYRQIFNEEFNIYFNKPKNDLCDLCEKYKILKTSDEVFENHLKLKETVNNERKPNRLNRKKKLVLCFDLQKVITCPQSFVNNFYYKRKIYNLTAHNSIDKNGYCAIWDEKTCGRTANNISSALHIILEKILSKYQNINNITLWSDSCVEQNKNSIMTFAMTNFTKNHFQINEIMLKFSTPGHGCV
jgi:hypothetical protein